MRPPFHILIFALVFMLTACATPQNHYDPIEPVNRVTDKINDSLDRVTLKPLAKGYTAAVPKPMRTAVSNFYDNAASVNTVLNDFLQGKGKQGTSDFMRFLINSTLGIGGLVDVASYMGFERHEEDFGQTLATWGMSQGAYIIYPVFGPNSVRNTPGFITEIATNPIFWAGLALAPYITIPVTVLNYTDKRARLLSASDMRDELALDPYVFTREAWRQQREYLIYDGNPPVRQMSTDDEFEEDDFEFDDFDSEQTPAKNETHLEHAPQTHIAATAAPASTMPAPTISPTDMHKKYVIFLSSHASESEATTERKRIKKLGVDSEIYPVMVNQRTWYRLRAGYFDSREDARNAMERLKELTGLTGAWLDLNNRK